MSDKSIRKKLKKKGMKENRTLGEYDFDKTKEFMLKTILDLSEGLIKEFCIYDEDKKLNAGIYNRKRELRISFKWFEVLAINSEKGDFQKSVFIESMGHEITHWLSDNVIHTKYKKFLKGYLLNRRTYQFISHCQEVHADYGGCILAFGGDFEKSRRALEYKRDFNKINADSSSHPSYDKRIEYLEYKRFDEELIRKIATENRFQKENVIEYVVSYYQNDFYKFILH